MPTGYTAKLMEQGQTFQEFVMLCARQFGACVMMKDDPMDAPIPEKFAPSDYHNQAVNDAKENLNRLLAMSETEQLAFGAAKREEAIRANTEWFAKEVVQNKRLADMRTEVQEWIPPTPEHRGLKAFMLQQIDMSTQNVKYIEDLLVSNQSKDPIDFYKDAVVAAKRTVEYHTKEATKEVERANSRTDWVVRLRQSLDLTSERLK